MNIVALYKTFSGGDFVELSIESIYSFCTKLVFIHSSTSWLGEKGNTVAPLVEDWKRKYDKEDKVINLYTDISDQGEQYKFGFNWVKNNLHPDFVLLIDSDEVWDEAELKKLLYHVTLDKISPAFSISLHTYIKSIFYRITPKEWCQPTVLVRGDLASIDGIRGNAIKGKRYLEDVYMHHFTYVRFNEQDVFKKILTTAATEKIGLVDINDWIINKWNKLPDATDFHTVDYAKSSWKGVRVIELKDLPEVMQKHPEVSTHFSNKPLLRRCSRVGVNVTWRCNWGCENCFYRFNKELHSDFDEDFTVLRKQVIAAKERGCDHVVMVGYGEPSLYPQVEDLIEHITDVGMTSSMITNGATGVAKFENFYKVGINHLHVSVHAVGEDLDEIVHRKDAGKKQAELKKFLKDNCLPWRTNTTIQSMNYQKLPSIISNIIDHGAFHVVLLGFLPHYEWSDRNKAENVLIPPKELRPYIEQASKELLQAQKLFTIRYHPFCHLSPDLWPYVTNAQYVLFDPFEWEYGHHGESDKDFTESSFRIGAEVSIKTEPCTKCVMRLHCGGWNSTYASLCGGAELRSITKEEVPDKYKASLYEFGGIHIFNPANQKSGHYSEEEYEC